VEVTTELGITNDPGPYPDGTFMAPEISPGGVAVFDIENDGRLDILAVRHSAPSLWATQRKTPAPNRLYRQEPNGCFSESRTRVALAGKDSNMRGDRRREC